jgi:hypothetical protein
MRRLRPQLPILLSLLFLLPATLLAQHPLTPPFRVDAADGQRQDRPLVAMNARGDFVVTWLRLSPGSQASRPTPPASTPGYTENGRRLS